MRLTRTGFRLRIPAPRWPSTDHRDYQTEGVLTARRRRRSQRAGAVAARRVVARFPEVSSIRSVRREDATLYVELLAPRRAAVGGRSPVAAGDSLRAASRDAARDLPPDDSDDATGWTFTLPMN